MSIGGVGNGSFDTLIYFERVVRTLWKIWSPYSRARGLLTESHVPCSFSSDGRSDVGEVGVGGWTFGSETSMMGFISGPPSVRLVGRG